MRLWGADLKARDHQGGGLTAAAVCPAKVTQRRRLRARSGRSQAAWRTGKFDPLRSYHTAIGDDRCTQGSGRSKTTHWRVRANPSTAEQGDGAARSVTRITAKDPITANILVCSIVCALTHFIANREDYKNASGATQGRPGSIGR